MRSVAAGVGMVASQLSISTLWKARFRAYHDKA
jgi:hypothetical protein